MNRRVLSVLVAAIAGVGTAHGAMVSYSASIPPTSTDWTSSVSIPQFDPVLGTLDSVDIELRGEVSGNIQFESLDAANSTVTTSLSASIILMRPDLTVMASAAPFVSHVDPVSAFDGAIDFDGLSGRAYLNQSASALAGVSATSPSPDLALFTGTGTVSLPVTATGVAAADGAGNLLVAFLTQASANVSVIYNYTVPEPASIGVLAIATLFARRRLHQ